MSIRLYELAGAGDLRFSPFCWRARMALAHKGLVPERVAVGFTNKELLAFSGQDKVPVLVDGDRAVCDSWFIACHLELDYPDEPSLFGGAMGRAMCQYINIWADTRLNAVLVRLIFRDLVDCVHPEDRDYFLETRLKRLNITMEGLDGQREALQQRLQEELSPLAALLGKQVCLSGDTPGYADYIVFGSLQWARLVSREDVLAGNELLLSWREHMLDLYNGLGRQVVG